MKGSAIMNEMKKQKLGKAGKFNRFAAILLCVAVAAEALFLGGCGAGTRKRKLVVLDTDVGTDDALAFLAAGFLKNVHIDYIVTSKGNTTLDGATRNAMILKNYLGLDAKIVRGFVTKADDKADKSEKSTFHGNDGLANISEDMIKEMGLTSEELSDCITYDTYIKEVTQCDEIEYIVIGPAANLANSLDSKEFRKKLSKVYVMGGGINKFNCSHNTEFNFFKDPQSAKKVLCSGKDITLFPLDFTNNQRVTESQINNLEKFGTFSDYITFLRFNRQSNIKYNGIDAAVIHDIMPVLYLEYPEEFQTEEMKIEVDQYGATVKSDSGAPIKVVVSAKENLFYDTLEQIFEKYDKRR